jgi:hypothetical protein
VDRDADSELPDIVRPTDIESPLRLEFVAVQRCDWCGDLVNKEALICPRCRTPLISMKSQVRRARGRFVVTLLVVLVVIAVLVFRRRFM